VLSNKKTANSKKGIPGGLGGIAVRKSEISVKNAARCFGMRNRCLYLGEAYNLTFQKRRKGVTIPYTDILIAACSLAQEAILLPVDAHLDLAAQFFSLKIESYVGKL
jgi:hypothetical protein